MQEDDFLKGTLVGAVIGAGLALLFAPRSGEETRSYLAKKARTLGEGVKDNYDSLVDRLVEEYREIKEMTDDEADDLTARLKKGFIEQRNASREEDSEKW